MNEDIWLDSVMKPITGIPKSMLDKSSTNSEILIDNYDLLRCYQNRKGDWFACYIRNDLSYTQINLFSNDIENVFFEIHLPKTKLITVGIAYRRPNESNSTNKETYILGDFNINLYHNGK